MLYSFQNLFEKMDIVPVREEYLKKVCFEFMSLCRKTLEFRFLCCSGF